MDSNNELKDSTNDNVSMNSLYILISFIAVVAVWFCRYVRMRRQRQIDAYLQNRARAWDRLLHRARVRIQNRALALANQRVRDRRQLILDNVIHKKVISGEKSECGGEITLLPPKERLLQNSLHTLSSLDLDEEEQGTMAVGVAKAANTATAMAMNTNTMTDPDPESGSCLLVAPEHANLNSDLDDMEEPRLLSSWRLKSTTPTCTSDNDNDNDSNCDCDRDCICDCSLRDERDVSSNTHTTEKESLKRKFSPLHPTIVCPICIEPFEPGDEVCWSKSARCHHVYHLDCMTEWLMENEECPLCRENYLCNNVHDRVHVAHDEDTVHR